MRQWFRLIRRVWLRCRECMRLSIGPICLRGFCLKWVRRNLCKICWLSFWRSSWRVFRRVFFRRWPYRCFCRRWRLYGWFFILRVWRRRVFRLPKWLHLCIWHRRRSWIIKELLGILYGLGGILDLKNTSFLGIGDTVLVELTHYSDINI